VLLKLPIPDGPPATGGAELNRKAGKDHESYQGAP